MRPRGKGDHQILFHGAGATRGAGLQTNRHRSGWAVLVGGSAVLLSCALLLVTTTTDHCCDCDSDSLCHLTHVVTSLSWQATLSRAKGKLDVAMMLLRRAYWGNLLLSQSDDSDGAQLQNRPADKGHELVCVQLAFDSSPVKKDFLLIQETSMP